eukprot:m.11514 g.11514  ORF g.11514 m.11514 type:complete len:197 (+) comp3161_c0_seq2:2-592(+)
MAVHSTLRALAGRGREVVQWNQTLTCRFHFPVMSPLGGCSYGETCLDNWLVTQAQQPVHWDVIQFNFGLHDLDNSTSNLEAYTLQLTNITKRLLNTGASLQYALTTPFMPDATIGDFIVEKLNDIATGIMKEHGIPIVDLYDLVTDYCGKIYKTCDICRKTPCSYHYNSKGETMQGLYVADAFRQRLHERAAGGQL